MSLTNEKKLVTFDNIQHYHNKLSQVVDTKQESLVSGSNIKTINGQSILGDGDISNLAEKPYVDEAIKNVKVDLTGFATEQWVNDQGFITIDDVPVQEIPEEYVTEDEIVNFVEVQDTNDVLDDVETNTYVKYVAQSLTDEQKAQVRENIGAGHAQSIYMSDGSTVEDAINNIENVDLEDYATKEYVNNFVDEAADIANVLNQSIGSKQDIISDIETIRQGAAKGATALQSYTEQYKGTVTGVKINGTTKNPSNGVVDIGTVITSHQNISGKQDKLVSGTNIKTINGTSILGSGDITINSSSSTDSISFVGTVNGNSDTISVSISNSVDYNSNLQLVTGVGVAFAAYNGNTVAKSHLFTSSDRASIVIPRDFIENPISWNTSYIPGYRPLYNGQSNHSLIYVPNTCKSVTVVHTGTDYNVSFLGLDPVTNGGQYLFGGLWQNANEPRTISLNGEDLYLIIQAKKTTNGSFSTSDTLDKLGITITLDQGNSGMTFTSSNGSQIYPIFENPIAGTTLYSGQKITISNNTENYCNIKFIKNYTTLAANSTWWSQSVLQTPTKMYVFCAPEASASGSTECRVVNRESGVVDQTLTLSQPIHGNVSGSFGSMRDEVTSTIYVSEWNGSRRIFVYNINDAHTISCTLQATIVTSSLTTNVIGAGALDACVDTDSNTLILMSYKVGATDGDTTIYNDSTNNRTVYSVFQLPETISGTITLTDSMCIDHYELPLVPYRQDTVYNNNKLYISWGFDTKNGIIVLDLIKKQYVSEIDTTNIDSIKAEPEGLVIERNALYLYKSEYTGLRCYKLEF